MPSASRPPLRASSQSSSPAEADAARAGSPLAGHHGSTIAGLSGAGFPALLRSVSGGAVGTVFALGLIEAGAVALLTISASTGYAVGECIGVSSSFNNSPRTAAPFYGANIAVALIAAAIILIPGAPLLRIALNANVLATVLLPITLIFLIMLANDRDLMSERWVNTRLTNRLAVGIVAFIAVCGPPTRLTRSCSQRTRSGADGDRRSDQLGGRAGGRHRGARGPRASRGAHRLPRVRPAREGALAARRAREVE